MREIVANCYISLDGVIDHPEKWSLNYFSDEAGKYATDLAVGASALLQGRESYESFSQVWGAPGADDFSNAMYEMPKYVVSTTLNEGSWNNSTVINENVVENVAKLKTEGDGYILTYGFGRLNYELAEAGLLDELRLWIHPVFVRDASEQTILRPGSEHITWKQEEVTSMSTGVTILRLRADN